MWRFYNTFKSVVFPLMAGALLTYFEANDLPIAITSFVSVDVWNYVGGAIILSILSSAIAGVDKLTRVE